MEQYTSPGFRELGTVEAMTAEGHAGSVSFDKIGRVADQHTPQNPSLDGKIVPDGFYD